MFSSFSICCNHFYISGLWNFLGQKSGLIWQDKRSFFSQLFPCVHWVYCTPKKSILELIYRQMKFICGRWYSSMRDDSKNALLVQNFLYIQCHKARKNLECAENTENKLHFSVKTQHNRTKWIIFIQYGWLSSNMDDWYRPGQIIGN
jgi:hypothetical protein